ncbi:hypothetical protein FSU_0090 [Fibrobacter succinogenes subsp. succinogenes S85]|uniref:Uncharacterized protein n=1 Tax=Fibrobacter succinogenes (strain ATCC 19169 / S85) TaxID=59374 RepID=D9S4F6_FIBSS|nr:hypothetical protein FSU_0090 [Fibrobacter succinogenes subsp. succinogenes S85]
MENRSKKWKTLYKIGNKIVFYILQKEFTCAKKKAKQKRFKRPRNAVKSSIRTQQDLSFYPSSTSS